MIRRAFYRIAPIFIGFILCFFVAGQTVAGPELRLLGSKTSNTLPLVKPHWPVPSDKGQVFYIQRSMNRNTVVYAARFDASGNLLNSNPLKAYWRRFAEQGQTRKLKLIEKLLAYGVSTKKGSDGGWTARFAALPKFRPMLRQTAPFEASLWVDIEGTEYRLVYGYLDIDNSSLIPKVSRLRLFTFEPKKAAYVTHMISVSGGEFR